MNNIQPKLEKTWLSVLATEFSKPYFLALKNFLIEEKKRATIYPSGAEIFNAFNLTPFDKVQVVIIGQDPYHGPNQAHGLSFSVKKGVHPPSLVNIFKELQNDVGCDYPKNGDLSKWAKQGVLLLNATLTVRKNKAGSHQNKGWEQFTDEVIKKLSNNKEKVVFLLWGGFAKKKAKLIDEKKHLILTSGHPSPLSANRGYWFGNKHFSKANKYLIDNNLKAINWQID